MQRIVIPGKPVPKARHQVRLYRGGVITYTPPKTREFERVVRAYAVNARLKRQEGDLATVILFHTSGPGDIDNLVKSVHDGLNGIAWEDDRQVVAMLAVKCSCKRGQEKTELAVVSLEEFMAVFGHGLGEIFREANVRGVK